MSTSIGIRGLAFERPAALWEQGPDRVALALTTLGIAASLVVHFTMADALETQFEPGKLSFWGNVVKPPIYYAAHAAEIVLILAAGLVALFATNFRTIERGYLGRFGLLIAAALLMAVRGYTISDWLSTRLVDISGPFGYFISVLVFAGARRSNWRALGKLMVVMAALFCAQSLVGVYNMRTLDREEAIARLAGGLNALYWPAAWIALKEYPAGSVARRIRFLPILIFGFGSLFTQTRLNFVMILGFLMVYSYIQYKRRAPQAAVWIVGGMLAIWLILFTVAFLRDTQAVHNLRYVSDAFSERLDEDTRTGQLLWFFHSVEPKELILGRGSFAKWLWGSDLSAGTDVGYLTILFFGGLPLLFTYVATHIKPCVSVLMARQPDWRLTAAGIVALWALRMLSSSYPNTTVDYYPVLLCVGACISREPDAARPWTRSY